MSHFIVIMHFLSFTSGIILITLMNFYYPKHKSPVVKHVLLTDFFYSGLLLLDTIHLYTRKNITYSNEILYTCYNLGQFIASIVGVYFFLHIIYDLINVEFHKKKKLCFIVSLNSFLLILCIIIKSTTFVEEYWRRLLGLFPYFVFAYGLAILYKNLKKVKYEIKNLVYSCLIVLLTIIPLLIVASVTNSLPYFMYKIPYIPIVYFSINAIGVFFIRSNITNERKTINTSVQLNENEVYLELANKYGLTEREQEIIKLIAEGHSNPEISETLFISPNTVKNHIYNIYRKIGIKNRYELISIISQMLKSELKT